MHPIDIQYVFLLTRTNSRVTSILCIGRVKYSIHHVDHDHRKWRPEVENQTNRKLKNETTMKSAAGRTVDILLE